MEVTARLRRSRFFFCVGARSLLHNAQKNSNRIKALSQNGYEVGCWLVVGCWSLVVGCWLLVVGCWLLLVGCWLLHVGGWLLVVGCWLLVVGCWLTIPQIDAGLDNEKDGRPFWIVDC